MIKIYNLSIYRMTILGVMLFLWIGKPEAAETEPITSPSCNQFTFDATDSNDPDNGLISYSWDFGDGTTATGPVTEHIYKKSGDYFVNLTITDNSENECSYDSKTQHILVNIPPFVDISAPSRVCANEVIEFDGSKSYDDEARPLTFSWDFGDGTTLTGHNKVTKSYSQGGTYEVSLTVDDNMNTVCNSATKLHLLYVNAPPAVDTGKSEIYKCVKSKEDLVLKFDASNTTDMNNDELTYTWDFGDGKSQTGSKVTHKYKATGLYDAKIIVDDNTKLMCSSSVSFIKVRLSSAPKAEAGADIVGCQGDEIVFDGSNSYSETKGTLIGSWNFGDGKEKLGLKATHTYASPGQYQAVLTVEDQINKLCPLSNDTRNVTINASPNVAIKAESVGCLNEEIQFDASSALDPDGDALEYYWTFGDGEILKGGSVVKHVYKQGGEFRVTVIVDDGRGSACSTSTSEMKIKINTPPVADAGPNLTCCVGKDTEFNAGASSDPDNDPLLYTWEFGDGTKKQGAKVTHTYNKGGSYNVVLTVDDNSKTQCSVSTDHFVAEVNTKPVATFKVR